MKQCQIRFRKPVILSEAKGLRRFRAVRSEILRCAQNDIMVIVSAGLLFLTACGHKAERKEATLPTVPVQTMEAQLARTPNVVEVIGTVRARLHATVAAKIAATVREIGVNPGEFVAAGQVLAQLDDRDLHSEFTRAKADYDRYKTLLDTRSATRAEFEAVESRYRIAEANLSHAQITAPFDGQITGKDCQVGDLATPGKPLFTLEQPTEYRLEVEVPERHALGVAVGKAIYCVIAATGEKCAGQVAEVVPAVDPATRSVLAKIALQCQQPIRSGMFGRAQLLLGERFAMFVPKNSVQARGQLTYVFVADAGKAQMRLVRTGKEYLGAVEILAGVQPGERVIIAGDVSDGQPVRE
ncbi:MAG: Solvent efflux pump periplasmic linker SrpA [Verrucomicrobiae bacterium]|nr:Solvent efflux pump periplasmic linker SrpA [Verrucomicrobiae bacterium]